MTSAEPGARLRTNATRVHAGCLFAITIAATVGSTLGWRDVARWMCWPVNRTATSASSRLTS